MTVIYKNANFISLNDEGAIYSVMVTHGKNIAYVGYNTPICYDSERVVDLNDAYVLPLINDMIEFDRKHARCTVLAEGERADFLVLDKNILNDKSATVIEAYKKGKKLRKF